MIYHFFVLESAVVDLKMVTKTRCEFKIYWAQSGQDYSARRMAGIRVGPGKEQYYFSIQSLRNVERLRIDTHDFTGSIAIKQLEITQPGPAANPA